MQKKEQQQQQHIIRSKRINFDRSKHFGFTSCEHWNEEKSWKIIASNPGWPSWNLNGNWEFEFFSFSTHANYQMQDPFYWLSQLFPNEHLTISNSYFLVVYRDKDVNQDFSLIWTTLLIFNFFFFDVIRLFGIDIAFFLSAFKKKDKFTSNIDLQFN